MSNFKCRICGHNRYIKNYSYYECENCSVMFKELKDFSLNRKLKIQYLNNYNLSEWGELDYNHLYDSGIDLRACINEPIELMPYGMYCLILSNINNEDRYNNNISPTIPYKAVIPFGIKVQPSHYDMDVKVYPRSGLGFKYNIKLSNGVGVVDNTFRGELKGSIVNMGEKLFTINPGDRVAQMVVEKRLDIDIVRTNDVESTARGENGFGSTGK